MAIYPDDGETLTDLLKSADSAMYAAKRGGRAQLRRFASEMAEASLTRFTIEALLRRALAEQEFRLRYQPIVDLATLNVVGVEALIAWETPERGVMQPSEFIPIAEQCGMIDALGEWTLATACREIQTLRNELGRDIDVAVNISPLQLRRADFPGDRGALPPGGQPAGLEPDHRSHRRHSRGWRRDHDRVVPACAPAGRERVDRRLRHGLFGAGLPDAAADQQAQDRQVIRR